MKLLIFDIDGTLANTKKVDDQCFIQAFESCFNIDLRHQRWEILQNVTDWGITEEIILDNWKRVPSTDEYERMKTLLVQNLKIAKNDEPNLFEEVSGATAFFNHLNEQSNYAIGIGTGAWEESALVKLSAIGIDPSSIPFSNSNYFKTRGQITQHVIEQATEKHKTTFDKIIYFGDGEWDFKTCQELGIPFIGIDVLNDGKLKKLGAKTVFQHFEAVEELLQHIEQ